jgi:uncharacterized integral membrane protein
MADNEERGFPTKLVVGGVLVVLLIIFWAQNRNRVRITFYGFHATTRIWVALALSALIGFFIGLLVARRGRD